MRKLIFLVVLLPMLYACGGQGGNEPQAGVGGIQLRAQWVRSGAAYQAMAAPAGVATVRIIVTGPGMANVQADFNASLDRGTVQNVPAGSGRVVTVQGLDDRGRLTYGGTISNVIVTAGQTTDAGTVQLVIVDEGHWGESKWGLSYWAN